MFVLLFTETVVILAKLYQLLRCYMSLTKKTWNS